MAPVMKPSLTEFRAAAEFCVQSLRTAETAWPTIYKTFQDTFGDKFKVEDEQMAIFDFALAARAL
jgi:hypothetical protein